MENKEWGEGQSEDRTCSFGDRWQPKYVQESTYVEIVEDETDIIIHLGQDLKELEYFAKRIQPHLARNKSTSSGQSACVVRNHNLDEILHSSQPIKTWCICSFGN